MVKFNSTPRLFDISSQVILMQTDTTVGFVSQDEAHLQNIKERPSTKPFLIVCKNFKTLKKLQYRVPKERKNEVRRAKKTTFIIKNRAFRVAQDFQNSQILRNIQWNYSTSANEYTKHFDRAFCEQNSDIIIEDRNSLHEGASSKLYKINSVKKVRLR